MNRNYLGVSLCYLYGIKFTSSFVVTQRNKSIKNIQYNTDDVPHPPSLESLSKIFLARCSCALCSKIIHACTNPFQRPSVYVFSCADSGAFVVATNTILVSSVGVRGLVFSTRLIILPPERRMLVGMISTLCSRRCRQRR